MNKKKEWARREHLINQYEALAKDAIEKEGFSRATGREVARLARNTASLIRQKQQELD